MYNKISAVYQIVNTVTNDRYVGSSKDVYHRCANHKCPSTWEKCPNSPMYQDMQKYGLDKFRFQILAPVMPEYLKQVEQEFIEMVQPTYNSNRANGWNVERYKEAQKKYFQSEKGKEVQKKYHQTEKGKEVQKKYRQSDKGKEVQKKYNKKLCLYDGETLTLNALHKRFKKARVEHPVLEAKKYIITN